MNWTRKHAGEIVLISSCIMAFLVLQPTLKNGFLSDDFLDLDHSFSLDSFIRYESGGFRPLITAVWSFDATVWGVERPEGWHLTNLILHAACAVLVWQLARQLGLDRKSSLLALLFFLTSFSVIPSIGRVSGRTTPIALIPLLAALIAHAGWVVHKGAKRCLVAMSLYLISLFAKETALLCPLLFASVSIFLHPEERSLSKFPLHTALYSIPVLIYLAWRISWTGLTLGYGESSTLGLFMMRNSLQLIKMTVSPWLDGIPVRMLLLCSVLLLVMIKAGLRSKLLAVSLLFLPLLTVSNLPPRSYYSYAALPGAAILFGMAAGRLRGRLLAVPAVVLIGGLLSQRDEVTRLVGAGEYTDRVIGTLDSLASVDQNSDLFVSGIEYGSGGYGTLWPGAFSEALGTAGSDRGSRIHTMESFWETVWPRLDSGEPVSCVLARFDGPEEIACRPVNLDPSILACYAPDTMIAVGDDRSIPVASIFYSYSTLIAVGTRECEVAFRDPFDPCSLIVLQPSMTSGDSSYFDMGSQESWLLHSLSPGNPLYLCSEARVENVILSSRRLWLDGLRERLATKEAAQARILP